MTDDLRNAALGFRLSKKAIDTEVEGFANVHDVEAAFEALKLARRNAEKLMSNGLNPGTPLKNWRWATSKIVSDIGRRKQQEESEDERRKSEAAYRATIKSGYVPNRETIMAQLEALYADGEISIQEYNWGMSGLGVVHGMIADGVKAENEADSDVPF